ncbi:cation:proton antiporter [Enterovirga sp.]|uniref:cation:proton antiporter domain-containing protein n=1 Tax=Enterovirga sp. TaxID=2026350 RepID=UPI002D0DF9AB|nr:cation:proton antiporter [Enterovirga sp.]HMO28218.1 cation:proton antiporter [Enterovirga sp.]
MAAASFDAGAYKEAILFLGTAGIVVPLFTKLRLSPVLGFIGAGALLGPFGLGRLVADVPWLRYVTISQRDEFAHLAELGVVFLLFTIGLELSWERLRVLRRLVFGFGAGQVFLSTALLAGIAMAFGQSAKASLIAGIALALSSTAIVIPILAAQRRLNSPSGRASFSILLFQDLAVAPILFTLAALGATKPGSLLTDLLAALGQAAVAIAVIFIVGRLALRPLFSLVAQTGSSELFMAMSFLTVIAAAFAAGATGLSMALGAFLAGLLLAETEYRRAIEAVVDPFKGLLLGIFFVSVGMGLDVTALLRAPVTIILGSTVVVLVKAGVIFGLSRIFKLPMQVGVETGILLGPGGEFAFVTVGVAVATNLLPADVGQTILVITTVTMIAIPLLARLARPLGQRLARPAAIAPAEMPVQDADAKGRVILAGFGRVGQLVAGMLERHKIPYLAIDANPALVAAQRGMGKPVYYGDSGSIPFLHACGIDTARALVITLDSPAAIRGVVEAARQERKDITIVSRARDARHAIDLYRLGVNDAVPETIEASLQLSEAVLVDLGVAMGPVIASIHERRDEFRKLLLAGSTGETKAEAPEGSRRRGEFRSRRTVGKKLA